MNEDTLILYYYNDGLSRAERRDIEKALRTDHELAAQYERLCTALDDMSDEKCPEVPAHTVSRWHDSIDRAAQLEAQQKSQGHTSFNPLSFFWGAAVTAALAIGIGIGVMLDVEESGTAAVGLDSAAFSRGVAVYMRDTQQQLATMPVDTGSDRALLIRDIVEQNRLYELAAERNDAADVARVLRAFEPILLRLAADDISPGDAEALRAQLAFELEVMLTKLSRATSNGQQST